MKSIWDGTGGSDRADRRGYVVAGCGCLVAGVALLLSLASVIASWIRDAKLME